ncbi:mRNA-binding ribosome synthesis protein nop7 [Coemansia sp. Benny D115]|nr:mRNA-binding ribosome synthesis protein nop7 [Coemansia sp. Benny D115]
MGKLKKKFTEGASKTYTTRNRALAKLQVSLLDFRRLCILKGIYPVEPRSRKRANRGSSLHTTFYYTKDIKLLLNEPLINKFREHKVFLRRLKKALGKKDLTRAEKLEKNRPDYTLDHLVIERYPTFVEALRDLDDALCMVFLFATMPVADNVDAEAVEECRRLSNEFMHYVIHTHSLRKVFLSIKGIYYQADIQGQSLTWVVPYQFSQQVPKEVDLQVMSTFLQFYRTLLRFVNYRLFTTNNLSYPPKVDRALEDSAAGLGSLRIEAKRVEDLIKQSAHADAQSSAMDADESGEDSETEAPSAQDSAKMNSRLNTLGSKIQSIIASTASAQQDSPAYTSIANDGHNDGDDDDEDAAELKNLLFANQVFYLSREVPRYSLEFVIRAFGGRLGWDSSSGGGSPYAENDSSITVQIADRPVQGHQFFDRQYLQPQWVYDCINARRLLDTEDYLVGQPLPPHLSPFVEYAEGDYVPEAASKLAAAAGFEGEVTDLQPEDRDASSDDEDEDGDVDGESADEDNGEDEDEESKAEKAYQNQLMAERAGMTYSEYQQKNGQGAKKPSASKGPAATKKRSKAEIDEEEREKIAISMLSKKKRRFVNRTKDEEYKRNKDINVLKTRKAEIDRAKGKKK